jgi:hypothetical protein
MERACCWENDQHFSQSESTPPMTDPLILDLGYLADNHAADRILAGTYQIPVGVDIYTTKLITELCMPDVIRNNLLTAEHVSTDDHAIGWPMTIRLGGLAKKKMCPRIRMACLSVISRPAVKMILLLNSM